MSPATGFVLILAGAWLFAQVAMGGLVTRLRSYAEPEAEDDIDSGPRGSAFTPRGSNGGKRNGELNYDRDLAPIGGGHFLRPDAAESFKRMRAAARAQGVAITITDSYRPLAAQKQCVATKGLYSEGGLCAEPGTSNHGWGTAVDVGAGRDWMRANGGRYGWVADVPREPWHFEYRGAGVLRRFQ